MRYYCAHVELNLLHHHRLHRCNSRCEGTNFADKHVYTDHPGRPVRLDVYLGETKETDHAKMLAWILTMSR